MGPPLNEKWQSEENGHGDDVYRWGRGPSLRTLLSPASDASWT